MQGTVMLLIHVQRVMVLIRVFNMHIIHIMYTDGYIGFEWDENKASLNIRKHNVSFESAADAFSDPYARVVSDARHSDYEERFFLIGMDLASRVLTACYCERCGGSSIRIISAGRPTKNEERQYWRYRNE